MVPGDRPKVVEADLALRLLLHLRDAAGPVVRENSTRDRIILAAVKLFATRGYGATSMRQIADGVGIRAASIYAHFSGKDELVGAAMRWVLDDFVAFATSPVSEEQDALEVLRTVVRRHAIYQLRFPERLDAWHVIIEIDRLSPFLPDAARTQVHAKRTLFIDLLEALLVVAFPAVDRPRERVRAVNTICGRAGWWLERENPDPEKVADFIWSLAVGVFTADASAVHGDL